jgi:hypothetical protein
MISHHAHAGLPTNRHDRRPQHHHTRLPLHRGRRTSARPGDRGPQSSPRIRHTVALSLRGGRLTLSICTVRGYSLHAPMRTQCAANALSSTPILSSASGLCCRPSVLCVTPQDPTLRGRASARLCLPPPHCPLCNPPSRLRRAACATEEASAPEAEWAPTRPGWHPRGLVPPHECAPTRPSARPRRW